MRKNTAKKTPLKSGVNLYNKKVYSETTCALSAVVVSEPA